MARFRRPHFSEQAVRRTGTFVVVLTVAVLLLCIWAVMWLSAENDKLEDQDRQSRADRSQLREDIEADRLDLRLLREQLLQLGEKPVVAPEDVPEGADVVVIPGQKGDRGESCIEEIGYPRCRGVEGNEGSDGSAGAAGASCVAELGLDACRGPKGDTGPAGPAGAPGADGKDGAPGTAQPGTYACPEGEYMTGFGVAADGSVALTCQPFIPGNSGGTQ